MPLSQWPVIVHSGCVLLVRRRVAEAELMWSFPGGKLEVGEIAEAAVVRETLEETGLTVTARRVLGERLHPATRRVITYVACDLVTSNARAAAADEVAEVAWCDSAQLAERIPGGVFQPVRGYLDAVLPGP